MLVSASINFLELAQFFLNLPVSSQQFIIGNPYYGLQIKTVADMKDYWFGEAIIIHSY